MIKYLFIDRDGTLIFDKHYLSDPEKVELIPSVVKALQRLKEQGIQFFIVTNQSGIGRGYFKEKDFFDCQKELEKQLAEYDITILDTAFCPHSPEENCLCRKPLLGMWEQLRDKYQLNPKECAMIGDKKEDVLFGIHAHFSLSCLVQTGKGEDCAKKYSLHTIEPVTYFMPDIWGVSQNLTSCVTTKNFFDFVNVITEYNQNMFYNKDNA